MPPTPTWMPPMPGPRSSRSPVGGNSRPSAQLDSGDSSRCGWRAQNWTKKGMVATSTPAKCRTTRETVSTLSHASRTRASRPTALAARARRAGILGEECVGIATTTLGRRDNSVPCFSSRTPERDGRLCSSSGAWVLSVWYQEIIYFSIIVIFVSRCMFLKGVNDKFLLSEDERLTPDIDKVRLLT